MTKNIIIVLLCLFTSVNIASAQGGYTNVNAADFKAKMEKDKQGVLVDLRTADEIAKGKIKGAVEIDFLAMDIEKKIDALDKSKTYYIYCAGGGRSAECAEMMVNKGFKNVYNLQKGFMEWKKAGLPIETK